MRQFSRVFVIAAASAVLAAGVATLVCHARIPVIPDREDEEGWHSLPLRTAYSTSGQEGMQDVATSLKGRERKSFDEMRQALERVGATNIVLARGNDLAEAIHATRLTLVGPRRADEPVRPTDGRTDAPFWLSVHFGSTHPWPVESIRRRGEVVRITFRHPEKDSSGNIFLPYFVWVPLGHLDPGRYSLELFDTRRNDVVLMRRVWVGQK